MNKTEARFWKYTKKTYSCWLWTGTLGPGGYGRLRHSELRKSVAAHRFAYELLVGPIPEGLQIDHLCRVHGCVNPAHLEPVTGKENQHRGFSFAGINHRKTHCPRNHPLSGENLYING